MEGITLIAATYKRPDIAIRLINSVPKNINIVIVNLSPEYKINSNRINLSIINAEQMPKTNAINLGVYYADKYYSTGMYYLITDDDVYFNKYTIFDKFLEDCLNLPDTGLIGITRIINKINLENKLIHSSFVYIGAGYLIKKIVFHKIGGFTDNNSADEWDICIKTYIHGYRNYRTKSSYGYHKQGTKVGGIKDAVKNNLNLGTANLYMLKYVDGVIAKISSGYETLIRKKSKFNQLAIKMHKTNNLILNAKY